MKRLLFALALILTLVSLAGFTGRSALSQERVLAPAQVAGSDVLLARSASGIEVWAFEGGAWQQLPNGPPWSDAGDWNRPEYYSTIQTGDVDGDGRAELHARGAAGMRGWEYEDGAWQQLPNGPAWSDAAGWNQPQFYSTIQTGDVDGDGRAELLALNADALEVWTLGENGWQPLAGASLQGDPTVWNAPEYYSTLQTADLDGEGGEELLFRRATHVEVATFDGNGWQLVLGGPQWSDAAGWNKPEYYSTIQTADVDGDGRAELLARSASNVEVWALGENGWQQLPGGPAWSDAAGWNAPQYYSTIQTADVDGDGRAELLARSASGIEVWAFDGSGWQQLPNGPPLSDAAGWDAAEYYSTIQTGDVDGDGRAEQLARSASGIHVWQFDGTAWQQLPNGPAWSDAAGWNAPEYYSTIQTANIEGVAPTYLPMILAP